MKRKIVIPIRNENPEIFNAGDYERIKSKKKERTHGSGGVTAAIKSSMSTLPLAAGVNSRDPSVDGKKRKENEEKSKRKGGHC